MTNKKKKRKKKRTASSHSRVVDCTITLRGDTGKDQSGLGRSLQRSRPRSQNHIPRRHTHTHSRHVHINTDTRTITHMRAQIHTHAHTPGKVCDEAFFSIKCRDVGFFSYGMLFDVCYYGLFLGPHSQNVHLLMPPPQENVPSLKLTMSSILCSLSSLDIIFLSSRTT